MSVSPFDDPLLSPVLGDEETARYFATGAVLETMLKFEAALARAEAAEGVISQEVSATIAAAIAGFEPDLDRLAAGSARDGMIVPELVRQIREHVGGEAAGQVHFGATSQDVIDTSLAIRMAAILDLLDGRLAALDNALQVLVERDGDLEVMAHTRMQRAIPVPARRIIGSWRQPLIRCRKRLETVRAEIAVVSFAGPAGTLEKLGAKGEAVRKRLADALDLAVPDGVPHSERDRQVALAGWLTQLSGSLGKMGQDIALLAQNEVGTIAISAGGGSSAMPHKVNPVTAETLVALARFNAALASGMYQAQVHENERSGAAWTLEWMVLPQMVMAGATGLRTARSLLDTIRFKENGPAA